MQVRSYQVLLREEAEGGYTVFVPALPGCITYGENITEAMTMARDAIDLYLESLLGPADQVISSSTKRLQS